MYHCNTTLPASSESVHRDESQFLALKPAYLRAERLGSKAMCQECSFHRLARAFRILSVQSRHWAAEWLALLHHTKSLLLVPCVQHAIYKQALVVMALMSADLITQMTLRTRNIDRSA